MKKLEKIIATEISPQGIDSDILTYLEENQKDLSLEGAVIYYGFPVFKDYEEHPVKSKFAILSKVHGLILLYTTHKHDVVASDENLSQLYSHVESSFKKSKLIRLSKSKLAIELNSFLFCSGSDQDDDLDYENEVLVSLGEIKSKLIECANDEEISEEIFNEGRSIVEGAKALTKVSKRTRISDDPKTKLNILIELEKEILNFDIEQRKIAISLINGPQRIRGLAGSGKTVVLAMKAAHIHLQHPTKKILFTFHTKSLYGLIKDLIGKFYRHFAGDEPNWEVIQVMHSWGGTTIDGVCFKTCVDNDMPFITFPTAQRMDPSDPFRYVCKTITQKPIASKYDYILIDEAQDLPNEFFLICYQLANGETGRNKNIVWAYDELQSIFNIYQRAPRELFGVDANGNANIDLERLRANLNFGQSNDFVLHKCYRNPLEVLITAHALGFGLYSTPVQMLQNKDHWKDVGYTVPDDTTLDVGSRAVIRREIENSPLSIYQHQTKEEIIQWFNAPDLVTECKWIVSKITESLAEGLRPHDILIISLDDRNAKRYFSHLSLLLAENGIRSNNLSILNAAAPPFQIEDMVTMSTVHKAKGNEAAMVFALGIDALFNARNTKGGRNKLFTAFTRTKAWLRISGMGEPAQLFFNEIAESMKNSPELIFTVPDPRAIETIERDLGNLPSEIFKLRETVDSLLKQGMTPAQIQMELNLGSIKEKK